MRTTLTLEKDVALGVRQKMQDQDASLKDTVNELIRLGLQASRQPSQELPRFEVKAKPLGTGLGVRYPKVSDLLEAAEGESYR
ncbi:MAG: hypothetical protein AAF725_01025 [Acidobacteriota bacterium]